MGHTTKVLDSMTTQELYEYRCGLIRMAIDRGYSWNWLAKNMNMSVLPENQIMGGMISRNAKASTLGNGLIHPPMKTMVETAPMVSITKYSPMANMEKAIPLYSVKNPVTSVASSDGWPYHQNRRKRLW